MFMGDPMAFVALAVFGSAFVGFVVMTGLHMGRSESGLGRGGGLDPDVDGDGDGDGDGGGDGGSDGGGCGGCGGGGD